MILAGRGEPGAGRGRALRTVLSAPRCGPVRGRRISTTTWWTRCWPCRHEARSSGTPARLLGRDGGRRRRYLLVRSTIPRNPLLSPLQERLGAQLLSRLELHAGVLPARVAGWRPDMLPALLFLLALDAPAQPLAVSPDHHFLQYRDGRPFFWLADTAWLLVENLYRAETERYPRRSPREGVQCAAGDAPAHRCRTERQRRARRSLRAIPDVRMSRRAAIGTTSIG